FVSRLRRPSLPSPFPSTTLFRSALELLRHAVERAGQTTELVAADDRQAPLLVALSHGPRRLHQLANLAVHGPRGQQRAHQRQHQDRKSTRLNSSHVKISYAVFCL